MAETADTADSDRPAPARADAPPRPRVRVAWIAARRTLERYVRFLQPLAVGLIDELVELTLLCPESADPSPLPSPPLEVVPYGRVERLGIPTPAAQALARQLRTRKIDLLHALDAEPAELTDRLARRAELPYVVTSYELADRRHLARLGETAAGVVATSEVLRADLATHHVVPQARIYLVRPGVYPVRHATCFENPAHSVAILAGAGNDDIPAFEALLRTFAELHARKLDCFYFIIAGPRVQKQLRSQAAQLNLQHELTFVDPSVASQLPEVFKAADLYVSPAPCPGVDAAALFAIAAGVPVLATAGGASDFLIDSETALLFRREDAAELTMKLTSLLDDRASARALAESALAYVRREHGAADKASAMADIYRRAVTPPPAER